MQKSIVASADYLEFHVGIAAITEAVHRLELKTIASAISEIDNVTELANRIARIDVLVAIHRWLPAKPSHIVHASQAPAASIEVAVRAVAATLAMCPIEAIVALGSHVGLEENAHRCHVSYDWLQAFRLRNGAGDAATNVIGRAYADGRFSVGEVAGALKMSPSDAVLFLESHGYCRPPDAHRLTDEARISIVRRLNADRVARAGVPVVSQSLLARDVIASERIERCGCARVDKLDVDIIDSIRTYTEEENRFLCANLTELTREVHAASFSTQQPSVALLCTLHRRLFRGVRSHAGKHRQRGWGSEWLNFGPNRSVHQDEVARVRTRLHSLGGVDPRAACPCSRAPAPPAALLGART